MGKNLGSQSPQNLKFPYFEEREKSNSQMPFLLYFLFHAQKFKITEAPEFKISILWVERSPIHRCLFCCAMFPKHVWHSSIGVQLNLSKALLWNAAAITPSLFIYQHSELWLHIYSDQITPHFAALWVWNFHKAYFREKYLLS